MSKLVAMIIIAWVPQPGGTLKEVWRIEKTVTLEHCLQMNKTGGAGAYGAIIITCKDLTSE